MGQRLVGDAHPPLRICLLVALDGEPGNLRRIHTAWAYVEVATGRAQQSDAVAIQRNELSRREIQRAWRITPPRAGAPRQRRGIAKISQSFDLVQRGVLSVGGRVGVDVEGTPISSR